MTQFFRKLLRALVNYDPSFCDMYEDVHAQVVAAEYLRQIRQHVQEQFGHQRLSMLDAGCQAGRLLIPLAQDGHTMVGLDASKFAFRRVQHRVKTHQLAIRLIRGDLAHLPQWFKPASLDAVICTEVLYLCQDYRTLLQRLVETVKPGGLLFVSHRPTLYYVAKALLSGKLDQAAALLDRSEGSSPDGAYHNWQTPEQLAVLYRSLGLRVSECYPIDRQPVQLNLAQASAPVAQLLSTTMVGDACHIPTYFFIVAQKPHD